MHGCTVKTSQFTLVGFFSICEKESSQKEYIIQRNCFAMSNRTCIRQMIAGIAFLNTPAIILSCAIILNILPLIYLVPIVWSVLILTTWLFLRAFIDHIDNLRSTFFSIYFSEGSILTLIAFLPQIESFKVRVILVL